ncbi:MAG TPA: cation diffusion facilitator family transporter [Spirochaetota bacterium]|nr:cation diffusion facilitator family transporter [Spirochaetota bacterium]
MAHTHHHHEHHHHSSRGKLISVIILNLIITASEFIGGTVSGSLSLISDAWHNLSDVVSLVLGYAGEKISARHPSKRYTFGLKRFEVFVALINALALVAIGIYIIYEAIDRTRNPVPIDFKIMLPVALIGLSGNIFSLIVLLKNRKDNINMRAAFLHLFYDAVSSVAVLGAAVILFFTGIIWADLAVSVIIAVMIFWSSLDIIKQSLKIFLQGVPDSIDPDEVYREILSVEGTTSLHGLHIWSVNSTEIFLSCHVCSDESVQPDSGLLIRQINSLLEKKFGITHTTIQIETTLLCKTGGGECCR